MRAVAARTHTVARQRAGVRILKLAGTRVRLTAAGRSRKETAAVIVLEANNGRTGAPSPTMIAEARRERPAAGEIKACLPPGLAEVAVVVPAAVAGAEAAVVAVVVAVEAVADADNRTGKTTQPLINGGIFNGAIY
jgi:hypothetical protein